MLFDQAGRIISEPRGIGLDTRSGKPIENEVLPPPSAATLAAAQRKERLLLQLFGSGWEPRKPITSGYNCAGHVWASRRTAIITNSAVELIISEDGYRLIEGEEGPIQGDVVIYWNRTTAGNESWMHTGIVTELRPVLLTFTSISPERSGRIPWVLNKWNGLQGEWLHRFDDVPFEKDGLVIKFYTDRP
jgi:hypothetical protein